MTTRDPRNRISMSPKPREVLGGGRDPTQSLSLEIELDSEFDDSEIEPSHPSLALGTADAARRDERTKIESPGARSKTPEPPRPTTRPPPIPRNADDPDERIGTVLGSYKVLELLGKGGMGYVYRAEHVKLAREVAIKLLRSDYARRRDAVFRFIQEARTVNRIRHRNIVDVPDIVELDDGTTFIVMEFLRGMSLGKWARSGIELPRALAVLVQICDGLAAAHSVSVVHRDLKPDNVIVVPTPDGAELVKLLDFGVAKLLNRDDEDVGFQTAAGSVIGTPAYMSPEQAGGMAVDARSDIYSLGAIMYELFCGQPMFRGRSFGEYVRKHLTELPVRPRMTPAGAELDERLEAMILRCLEKDPEQRYASIVELRDQLLAMLGAMETHLPAFASLTASGLRPPPHAELPAPYVTSGPSPSQLSQHYPSHQLPYSQVMQASQIVGMPPVPQTPTPWWVWAIGGAVAVSLGVGAAVWYAGRTEPEPAPPSPGVATLPAPAAGPPSVPRPAVVAPTTPTPAPPSAPASNTRTQLRFDSLPSGGVFADGQSAELCRTPCNVDLDLGDGGPADKRTFFVKAAGYADGTVVVDLTASVREFRVTLHQRDEHPTEPQAIDPVATRPTTKPGHPRPKPTRTTPATEPTTPVEPKHPDPPVDVKPPEIKKPAGDGGKIDPAETLDPFRRKRP